MKKQFLLLALIMPMLAFTGCGDDDPSNSSIALQFDENEINVIYKNIGYINTNKECDYTSENTSIATVDKYGKVSGVGVGETYIVARSGSESARCKVTVSYLYNIIDEPILDFSKTADEIKRLEQHEFAGENIQYVTTFDIGKTLYYNAKTSGGTEYQYHYCFIDKEGKSMLKIYLDFPDELASDILLMMYERYEGGVSSGGTFKFADSNKGINITMTTRGLIYTPIQK